MVVNQNVQVNVANVEDTTFHALNFVAVVVDVKQNRQIYTNTDFY